MSEGEAICRFVTPSSLSLFFAAGVTRRRLCDGSGIEQRGRQRWPHVGMQRSTLRCVRGRVGRSIGVLHGPLGGQHGLVATHRTLRLSTQRSVDRIPSILSGEQCELGGASGQSSGFCQIVKLSTHLTITRTGDPEISLSSTTRLVWPIFLEHSLDNESIDRMVAQTLVTCRSRS